MGKSLAKKLGMPMDVLSAMIAILKKLKSSWGWGAM